MSVQNWSVTVTRAAPSVRDSVTGVGQNLSRSDQITTGTSRTYRVPTQDSGQFSRKRVSAAQTKRTKQPAHAQHGFPSYTVLRSQQESPRTSENTQKTLTCHAEPGAILQQAAGHRVWLGNQTVKFVLPKGNPLGAKYTAARYRSQLPGKRTEEMGESFKIRTRCCILVSEDKPSNVAFVDQLPRVLSRAVWTWPSAWFSCCITEVPLCFLQRSHLGLGFI